MTCCGPKKPSIVPQPSANYKKDNPYYQFVWIDYYTLLKKSRKSIPEINKILEKYPDFAFLYYILAQNYIETTEINKAIEACKKAVELDNNLTDAKLLLGKLYLTAGLLPEATKMFENIIQSPDTDESVYIMLARSYVAMGQTKRGIETIQKLIRKDPDSIPAYLYLGSLYAIKLKDYKLALQWYNKALEIEPDNLVVKDTIAQFYVEQKKYEKALPILLEIERYDPENIALKLRIALIYYEQKNYDNAIEKFQTIIKKNKDADKIYYYLGLLYESLKKYTEAINEYSHIPANSSFYKESQLHIASLYRMLEQSDKAVEALRNAISKNNNIPEFYELAAALLEEQNKNIEAIEILKKGKRVLRKNENIVFLLGILYEKTKDRENAFSAMQAVLEINPSNPSALNYVGYSLLEKNKDFEKAKQMIQQASQLRPNDGYITDSLGWVFFKEGNNEEALKYLFKANLLSPNEPTILEHIGDVYFKINQQDKALEYYQKAIDSFQNKDINTTEADISRIQLKVEKLKNNK